MSAKRYPPLLDWVELGAIAAAPLSDVCVCVVVADTWEVVVSVGTVAVCPDMVGVVVVGVAVVGVVVVACELVVLVDEVVPGDVAVVVPVDVAVLVEPDELVESVEAAGNGAPGVGGSVEAFGPVTSAPFLE
ncbi:MAG TPA: hypothetical protein VFH80_20715, partial [Solirubrobacteraceae bacterium]|nr:hypothetical protein [Solirubrobacteraceae bacterium]